MGGGGRGRPLLFDVSDLDLVDVPLLGAPVKGDQGEAAWDHAAEACAAEIRVLPTPVRRQFIERLSREMELALEERAGGSGEGIAKRIRRLRTTRTSPEGGLAFNMQLVKAHVMRDLLGVGHAAVARHLEVSTSTLYRLLDAWNLMLATGELPIQQSGDPPGPSSPVAVNPDVLQEIAKLPAKSQGSAFLRAARKVDPASVRNSGRRSPTLSSGEVSYMKYKEQTVAPQIMADPGGSGAPSPVEVAIGRAYGGDDDYEDGDGDWDSNGTESYEYDYEAEDAAAAALDADDAGLEEYEAIHSGRPWPTPEPDPCVCTNQGVLRGFAADSYVEEHLIFKSRDQQHMGLYECPATGRQWHQDWPNAGPSSWGDTRLRQLRS